MHKKISFPSNCRTNDDYLEFLYIAQEKLRLEHNKKGKEYREKKLTVKQWKEYLEKEFKPRSKRIGYEIAVLREKLGWSVVDENDPKFKEYQQTKEEYKRSTKWTPDLKEI